jgi:O-antigen ligase
VSIKLDSRSASRLFSGLAFGGLALYTLSSTLTISGVTLGLILASTGWVGRIVLGDVRFRSTLISLLPLVFLFTMLISAAHSGAMVTGLDRFRSMAASILLYYIVLSQPLSKKDLRRLAGGVMAGALIATVYHLGMLAFDTSRLHELSLNRALGGMLGMVIPFSMSLVLIESKRRYRNALRFVLVLMLVVLILTSTRGAWAGCFAGIALLGVLRDRRILLFLSVALVLFLAVFPRVQSGRALNVFDPRDSTIRKRITLWQTAFSMAEESILFGKGPGSYKLLYREYLPEGTVEWIRPDHSHAHNIFIHTLAETGIIGVAALAVLLGAAAAWVWKVYRRLQDPWLSAMTVGILAGVVGFLVHGQVDYTLAGRTGFLFWFYLGMVHQTEIGAMEDA